MGKHNQGAYQRVARDLYPTAPRWPVTALAEHIELRGTTVWEMACGHDDLTRSLLAEGCKKVFTSDVKDYGGNTVFDFLSGGRPKRFPICNWLLTNPPFGQGGRTAVQFAEMGLKHLAEGAGGMALLLPHEFDAGKTRVHLFRDNPHFVGKLVLMKRIMWFEHPTDPNMGAMDNSAWFIFTRKKRKGDPILMYGPTDAKDK